MSCENIPSIADLEKTKLRVDHFGELIDGTPSGTSTNPVTGKVLPTYEQAIRDVGFKPASFDFVTGGTLNPGDYDLAVRNPTPNGDNNWYSWGGALPKVIPPNSTPESTGGLSETAWTQRSDDSLKAILAGNSGTSLIGMHLGITLEQYLATGRLVDPRMPPFNYKSGDTLSVKTASIQSAIDYCNTNKAGLLVSTFFEVDRLVFNGHTDYSIVGNGGFICHATTGASIEYKNCRGLFVQPGISLNSYAPTGIKVWGQSSAGGSSLLNLGYKVIGAGRAWEFGDTSEPDVRLSEIVISDGSTFNCGEVFWAYGSQTVIEFNRYQLIAGGASTPVGPSGQYTIGTVVGAVVRINGGECIKAANATGIGFTSNPINSPSFSHSYGRVMISGAAVECAGPWFIAYNPAAVASIEAGSGGFSMANCHGYFGQNVINCQVADNFTGQIVIDSTCRFHRLTAKTTAIVIASAGAAPQCDIQDISFDNFFPKGFQKFNGPCVPSFTYRRIGKSVNLAGLLIPGSSNQTVLKFTQTSIIGNEDNTIFLENYNPATGIFTVPKGGLKNVFIYIQWDVGGNHDSSDLFVMLGGTKKLSILDGSQRRVNGFMEVGNLSEGDTISLKYQNGGSTFNCYTKADDYFCMYASR